LDTFHFNFNLFHFPTIHHKVKDHMDIEIVKQYKLYKQVIVTIINFNLFIPAVFQEQYIKSMGQSQQTQLYCGRMAYIYWFTG
jgi:hypothetical protein